MSIFTGRFLINSRAKTLLKKKLKTTNKERCRRTDSIDLNYRSVTEWIEHMLLNLLNY